MADFSPFLSSRRQFIRELSERIGLTVLAISSSVVGGVGAVPQQKNEAKAWEKSKRQQELKKKLGVAFVGLGKYSTEQLAPALTDTEYCRLTGIVTGTPEKAEIWKRKYNLQEKNIYNYENFDKIKDNPDVDIVYVVLPNAMHAEYTIRAAKAGKHVICEKPMAVSIKECDEMIAACKEANRLLFIGYRLHFEPHTLSVMEFAEKKTYGDIKSIAAKNGFDIEPNVWRLNKDLAGGGPLMDVGIYCVQAALYATGMNPIGVTAKEGNKTDLKRFKEVEQSLTWQMTFPNGAVANCETSYAEDMDILQAEAERGWFKFKPAYAYKRIKGETNDGKLHLTQVNQQACRWTIFLSACWKRNPAKYPGKWACVT